MNRCSRSPSLLAQAIQVAVVAIALGCLFLVAPAIAQTNPKAPIVLDGRRLFEVSQSGGYTAQERAADANRILKIKVKVAQPPLQVAIDETQEVPVIQLDGNHLLSVTSADAPDGRSVEEQAQIWAGRLEDAIKWAQHERTPGYLIRAVLLSVGCVVLVIASNWSLGWVGRRWIKPLLERDRSEVALPAPQLIRTDTGTPSLLSTEPTTSTAELSAKILLTLIRAAIWLSTLIYISDLFPQTREWSRNVADTLTTSLTSDLFPLGDRAYSVLDLVILISLFAGLVIVARTVKTVLRSRFLSITGLNRSAQETIALIANYTFIFIGTIVVLQLWGLDITSLTVFASVLGVGIGLGLQGIAKEFISGLVLIFERPIQVGDFVNVGDLMGTVERISVRSTEIRTLNEISIIVPNSRFLESEVVNWSHGSPVSRLQIPVGIAYGANLSTVRGALIDATKDHPDVLAEPAPKVLFKGFGDNALDFDLLVWIAEPRKQFRIKSDLYFRMEAILRHRDIEIPFPQRDLHIRSGSLPIEVSPPLAESLAQLAGGLAKWLESQAIVTTQDGHNNHGASEQEQVHNS